jgi:hypothetical protein
MPFSWLHQGQGQVPLITQALALLTVAGTLL